MTETKKSKLVLFDGNAILHRAYHAFPMTLRTREGELTNAVYGFTSILLSVVSKIRPGNVVVAFDEKGPTFRHEQFAGYKASRPKMDDELAGQIDRTRQIVDVLNIPRFSLQGYEADDVIGTLALQAEEDDDIEEIIIVTADRDIFQLITDKVHVLLPAKGKQPERLMNKQKFEEEYSFTPSLLVDYKALAGDQSDEIPGVAGVGPKTATNLITKYGCIEDIYQKIDEIPSPLKEKLDTSKEIAFLSKQLATIDKAVPVKFDKQSSHLKDYDKDKAISLFEELSFKSLIRRLPGDNWEDMVESTLSNTKKESKKTVNDNQMKLF